MIPFRSRATMKEIVFIRHAESQANLDGVWNGRTDGPLSADGAKTLGPLGDRVGEWRFDRVISSPLERTRRTAESFSDDVEIDDDFIEIDLGRWEGRQFAEIQEDDGEELARAIASRTIPMGGTGESLLEAGQRAIGAVDRLFESMSEGDRVAVVTHGGFLQSVLHRHLAGGERRVHAFTGNTAITRVIHQFGMPRLATFNDLGHLGPNSSIVQSHLDRGETVVALVRHGRTQANVEGRWQGQGDWDLDDLGFAQARALGEWWGRFDTVYTSPLKRAVSTANQIALNGFQPVDRFMELNMGRWEGMTTDEILEQWPQLMEKIYRHGVDLKRGETGESWGELVARFASAVEAVDKAEAERTVVVAHGGAIRAFISSLTKSDDTHAESLFTPANTSMTHVAYTPRGLEIIDYAVAPHLETLK
jgi:broad specificity phosphatase PhoE